MRAFIRQVQRPTQFFRLGAMPKLGAAGRRHVNARHGGAALGHGTRTMASLGALIALSIFIMGADQIPLPEHPRPDLRRDAWVNLNGAWDFEFDPNDVGRDQKWFDHGTYDFSRRINVPFPWESKLSGIADPAYRGVAWYARQVTIPADWQGKDAWIVFGAVDFEATVWANGWRVASHVGGYTPFAAKLSGIARPGDTVSIVVRARDVTDREQPTGKQVDWYTRTSGIWQTVYLEARGSAYVNRLRIVASLAKKQAKFTVAVAGRAHSVVVETAGVTQRTRAGRNREVTVTVPIDNPRAWHPDDPQLYDATVTVLDDDGKAIDRVQTYFGLRDIGVAQAAGRSYKYITLNGKPLYLRGALHQSFHPDGIYQYPSDALLKHDYVYAKRIGLNFFRIHIKAEIPRALYWADRLGVLIMQDMPNPWRQTEQARIWYEAMLREVIERDFNHPSIFSWCDFNETWGLGRPREFKEDKDTQQWVRRMYELTKQLDPTRLAEDNSPCNYDHVATDINSWHFYINDYARAREHIANVVGQTKPGSGFNYCPGLAQSDAPLINSEYGGISAGLGDQDISWCFKYLTNELRLHDKICGYIYTEQSDIEWEHNGFLNYDRSEKEYGYDYWFPGFGLADINAADFVVLDVPPCQTVKPGQTVEVPVSISHWSSRSDGALLLKWSLRAHNGLRFETAASGQQTARWSPHRVVRQIPLRVTLPAVPVVAALNVEVVDRAGQRIAANYVNFHVYESPAPRVQVVADKTVALRFRPSDMAEWAFSDDSMPVTSGIAADKAAGRGAGVVVYEIQIPENIPLATLETVTFLGELSARAGDEKLAWPARKRATDYPQSDGTKWPSTVRISINGATTDVHLPDDPADARGVLSHHYRHQPGSYGYPIMVDAPTGSDALRQIARDRRISVRLEVPSDAEHVGGLAIYGERLGRYPLDPTILLTFKEPHGLPSDYRTDEAVAVDRLTARRETVLPTAEQRGAIWRYTTTEPDRTWRQPDFDDTAWKRGRGGFGTQGTPNAHIGTTWDTPAIWLRTTFDLSSTSDIAAVLLRFYHDEDILVAINGQRVLRRAGYEPEYVEHALGDVARRALRQGKNVIAVRCRQTGGGQAIDVGVDIIRRAN